MACRNEVLPAQRQRSIRPVPQQLPDVRQPPRL
jgi:hypothetical protein